MKAIFSAMFVALVLGTTGLADVLVRNDGTRIQGTVVSEDAKSVKMEVMRGKISAVVEVPRTEVAGIEKELDAPVAPSTSPVVAQRKYYVLQVAGEIGKDCNLDSLRLAYKDAADRKIDAIILEINTLGGGAVEAMEMARFIQHEFKIPTAAYVKRALSAGAIIAMGCKDIYMAEDGTIGGAVPYKPANEVMPMEVDAKFKSIMVAGVETIVTRAGHNPILARAMIEVTSEVWSNGSTLPPPILSPSQVEGAICVKQNGTILTMTATDAVNLGLAKFTVDGVDAVAKSFGDGPWSTGGSWLDTLKTMSNRIAADDAKKRKEADKVANRLNAQLANEPILQAIAEIDIQLGIVRTDGRAALDSLADTNHAKSQEIRVADTQYKTDLGTLGRAFADRRYNATKAEIDRAYVNRLLSQQDDVNRLNREQQRLMSERKKLQQQLR